MQGVATAATPPNRSPGPLRWLWLAILVGVVTGCDPPGRRALLEGERLLRADRPAQAVEPFKESVRLFATNAPAAAQAWNYLGLALQRAGRPAEAAIAYQNALLVDFNLVEARFNRGCLFLDQNNFTSAISELTSYTTHRAKDPQGWARLGLAQLRVRQLDVAERSLRRVFELNPSASLAAETLNNLGVIQSLRRRPADAMRFFDAALKYQTNHPPSLLNQAVLAHQYLNDRTLAVAKYRAYLDAAGTAPNAANVLALVNQLEAEIKPRVAPTNQSPAASVPIPPSTPSNIVAATTPSPQTASTPPTVVRTGAPPTLAQTSPPPFVVRPATPLAPPPTVRTAPPTNALAVLPPTQPAKPLPPAGPPPTGPGTSPTGRVQAAIPPLPPTNRAEPLVVSRPPPELLRTAAVVRPPATPPSGTTVIAPPTPQVGPQVEFVDVPTESPPKPALDVVPPPSTSTPAFASTRVVRPTSAPPTEVLASAPAARTNAVYSPSKSPKPAKKSFIQRVNPLSWFGSKNDDKAQPTLAKTPPVTPLTPRETAARPATNRPAAGTPPTARVATPAPASPALATPAAAPPPSPQPPKFQRYRYQQPSVAPGDSARSEALFVQGFEAQKAGANTQAMTAYRAAIQADPSNFAAQFNLGVTAFDSAVWPEALRAFEAATRIKPADESARLNFALTLDRASYPIDAVAELDALVAGKPDTIDAHLQLASLCAQKLADIPKARLHYRKVLDLDPNHPQADAIRRWLVANR